MMKPMNIYFCAAALLSLCLSAAGQGSAGTKTLTLFKGEAIREVQLSGGFEVEIRQGTPNGVVLEVPQDIPVDTVYDQSYGDIKWLKQAKNRKDEFKDTVQCSFVQGILRINNLRPLISHLGGGGFNLTWDSGPKGKAIITVGDLRSLRAYTRDTVRFVGKMRTTETELYTGPMEGLDITATRSVSIHTWVEAALKGRITATPQVEIKMNTKGTMDLTLDSVGYLSVLNYAGGRIELSGTVDSLYTRTYGQGVIDTRNLKAGEIVPSKAKSGSGLSDGLGDGTYILEKKGKTVNIRQKR